MATNSSSIVLLLQQPQNQSIEHQTLAECTHVLTTEIAAGPLEVAQKCYQEGLVTESLVRTMNSLARDDHSKASELVLMITSKVGVFPDKFHLFLRILHSCDFLQGVCRIVEAKYEEKRRSASSDENRVGRLK